MPGSRVLVQSVRSDGASSAVLKNVNVREVNRTLPSWTRCMRHTFATLSLMEGAPLANVSKQLGHADKAITLRVYTHWLPDTDVEQPEAARRTHHVATDARWKSAGKNGEPDFHQLQPDVELPSANSTICEHRNLRVE